MMMTRPSVRDSHRLPISLAVLAALVITAAGCSSDPTPEQQVRKAADDFFGESTINSIYITGTKRLCRDLEYGYTAEQSLADADPITTEFYIQIAGPLICPELLER